MIDPVDSSGIRSGNGGSPPAEAALDNSAGIDLQALLFRHHRLVIGFGVLGAVLGVLYAFATPRTYAFSSVIEIGRTGSGIEVGRTDNIIENPDTTVAKIANGFAAQVEHAYRSTVQDTPIAFDFEVKNPRGSNLVIVTSKGPEDQQGLHLELHKQILDLLVVDHRRILDVARKSIEVEMGKAERDLDGVKEQEKSLILQRVLLDETRKLLDHETRDLKSSLTAISTSREVASKEVAEHAKALTLLMIDTQVLTNQVRLATLEERLNVGLVQEAERIRQLIGDNARSVQGQMDKITELKIKRDNMQETRMVVPPMRSLRPVGIGRSAMVAVGLMIGAGVGIGLAYFRQVNRRA